jgi:hypothetical protein
MNMFFNKSNTKKLIEASHNSAGMSRTSLDWRLENRDTFCGCIRKGWFSNKVFLVVKHDDEYKLICSNKKGLNMYLIEDIDAFLDFINIEDLYSSQEEAIRDSVETVKKLPANGVIIIQNRKIFLYDFVVGGNN